MMLFKHEDYYHLSQGQYNVNDYTYSKTLRDTFFTHTSKNLMGFSLLLLLIARLQ